MRIDQGFGWHGFRWFMPAGHPVQYMSKAFEDIDDCLQDAWDRHEVIAGGEVVLNIDDDDEEEDDE